MWISFPLCRIAQLFLVRSYGGIEPSSIVAENYCQHLGMPFSNIFISIRDVHTRFREPNRTPERPNRTQVRFGVRQRAQFSRTHLNAFEPGSNARTPRPAHMTYIRYILPFWWKLTIYNHLNNILIIYYRYYKHFIQFHCFTSIDSHAPIAMPLSQVAPEDPSAQTKLKIFGIFPF